MPVYSWMNVRSPLYTKWGPPLASGDFLQFLPPLIPTIPFSGFSAKIVWERIRMWIVIDEWSYKETNLLHKVNRYEKLSWGQDQAPKKAKDWAAQKRTTCTILNTFSDFLQCKHYPACSAGEAMAAHNPLSVSYILKDQELIVTIYKSS